MELKRNVLKMKRLIIGFALIVCCAVASPADVCEEIEGAFRNATEQGEIVSPGFIEFEASRNTLIYSLHVDAYPKKWEP